MILRKSVDIFKIEAQMKVNDIAKISLLKRRHIIVFAQFTLFAAKIKKTFKKKIKKLNTKLLTIEQEIKSLRKN